MHGTREPDLRTVFEGPHEEHEHLAIHDHPATGARIIIAVHSTTLGPALGGTRLHPYRQSDDPEAAALADAKRLSIGMTYKNALAGLPLGGGKAVILADPATDKNEDLLRSYAHAVARLRGRYITACDVGTTTSDMDTVAEYNPWTVGRSLGNGGCGDTSVLTAHGVHQAMRAVAQHLWGTDDLTGRRIGISGAGKVDARLARHLLQDGAHVMIADPDPAAIRRLGTAPAHLTVHPPEDLLDLPMDIYAPCALGGVLTPAAVPRLRVQAICGAANNQLADPRVARLLYDHGVLYLPDYAVNAGGVIQAADELGGYDETRARTRALQVHDTVLRILATSGSADLPPLDAAESLARERLHQPPPSTGRAAARHSQNKTQTQAGGCA
ncbi:Glu/Leu/Phe/Val dehydrogenase dimerization domain-containing protein [Streptomyces venezuelae]|uniref:Glu/Leu/Phe/Val family dehydrogenase n=1 Tax=Streptomyces venezuelae TaxID=54571 RepID=UPI00343DC0A6